MIIKKNKYANKIINLIKIASTKPRQRNKSKMKRTKNSRPQV